MIRDEPLTQSTRRAKCPKETAMATKPKAVKAVKAVLHKVKDLQPTLKRDDDVSFDVGGRLFFGQVKTTDCTLVDVGNRELAILSPGYNEALLVRLK
jgi:hypothetical protein